jgi:hypothetical protein
VLFSYASKLSKEFDIPWIADYRDTWVQDKTRSGNRFTKGWNSFFERRFLRNAKKISTVSTFIMKQLQQNLPDKDYEIILNGFNPDVMYSASEIEQKHEVFTISFAGTIYKWHPIQSFLKVCNDLIEQKKIDRMKLQFYGINNASEIQQTIQNKFPALIDHISIFPKTENEELVKKLAESNAFLLFNDYSILGTKIFTYIGIKRKIILCYSEDKEAIELKKNYYNLQEFESESKQLQANLLHDTDSGIVVKNENHLKHVLIDLNDEFQLNNKIACDSKGIEKYSRKMQIEKLAEIVKSL